jgi:DNA-binding beta-propeller fold protein YncE
MARAKYIIAAALAALSCRPEAEEAGYVEAGRLNFPLDTWEPVAVAAGDDGRVYVADASANGAVQVFDAARLYVGGLGGLGKGPGELFVPLDVAAGPGGTVYAAEFGTRRVSVFGPDGRLVRLVGEGVLTAPFGVAAGPKGEVYVADAEAGGVFVFSREGELVGRYGADEGVARAWDVTCADDGRFAVIVADGTEVFVFYPPEFEPRLFRVEEEPSFVPVECAFGPRGRIFVLGKVTSAGGTEDCRVFRLSPGGLVEAAIECGLTSPTGLAVARDGAVYVADGPRRTVSIYRPDRGRRPPAP